METLFVDIYRIYYELLIGRLLINNYTIYGFYFRERVSSSFNYGNTIIYYSYYLYKLLLRLILLNIINLINSNYINTIDIDPRIEE